MRLPVVWHEAYEVDIGPHVYPTTKYRLVRARVLEEGIVEPADVRRPEPVPDDAVALVHTADYLVKIRQGTLSFEDQILLEVPFSAALRDAAWLCAGGTILAAHLALERGVAVHLGGGFHHAFPDHGEGFCLINDVAIAIRVLQRDGRLRRAAVIDLDVHHGNGTAAIFAGDADVLTFSMHQQHNYPAVKPPSDIDVGLEDGARDAEYLEQLERHLPAVLVDHRPELVLYLAGADPYEEDQLGGLGLTMRGLARRDALVLEAAARARVPLAATLAGGYARQLRDTVEIHANTVRAAKRFAL